MKRAIDDDIEDYFAMQERKTAKGKAALTAPPPPEPTPAIEEINITVEESPGQDGPETIIEKINRFWDH